MIINHELDYTLNGTSRLSDGRRMHVRLGVLL